MKQILQIGSLALCLALAQSITAQAQDTVFYRYPRLRVPSMEQCNYYSLITKDSFTNKIQEIQYNKSGNKVEEQYYFITGRDKINTGTWKTWFPDGTLETEISYENNKKNGLLKTFWPDGTPKRVDTFVNDSCVAGTCYNQQGKEIEHFDYHIPPQFPGGVEALFTYLRKKIYYPQRFELKEGKVMARFLVTKEGTIEHIELLNNPEKFMGRQVIRAIKQMPDWIPGKLDGEPDEEFVLLPVTFIRQ